MANIDFTRKMAMDIARLTKKIEELASRVSTLESERDSGGASSVPKLSPKRIKQLKDSVAQS